MSLSACDFSTAIANRAAALGRQAMPDRVEILNTVLQTLTSVETGTLTVSFPEDEAIAFDAYLDAQIAHWPAAPSPAPAEQDEWVRVRIGTSTGWRKASDPMLRVMKAIEDGDAKATADKAKTWVNPWTKGKENRTQQQVLLNTNPALAARYKIEAGV